MECCRCKEDKPVSEFPVNKYIARGYNYACKACVKEYNRSKLGVYQRCDYIDNLSPEYIAEQDKRIQILISKYAKVNKSIQLLPCWYADYLIRNGLMP